MITDRFDDSLPAQVDRNTLKKEPKVLAKLLIAASKDPEWCQSHSKDLRSLVSTWLNYGKSKRKAAGKVTSQEVDKLCLPFFRMRSGDRCKISTPEDSFLGILSEPITATLAQDSNKTIELPGSSQQAELTLELMRMYRLDGPSGAADWIAAAENTDSDRQAAIRGCFVLTFNNPTLAPLHALCQKHLAEKYATQLQSLKAPPNNKFASKLNKEMTNGPRDPESLMKKLIKLSSDPGFINYIVQSKFRDKAWLNDNKELVLLLADLYSIYSKNPEFITQDLSKHNPSTALLLSPVQFKIGDAELILPRILIPESPIFEAALEGQKEGEQGIIVLPNYTPQAAHNILQFLNNNSEPISAEMDDSAAMSTFEFAHNHQLKEMEAIAANNLVNFFHDDINALITQALSLKSRELLAACLKSEDMPKVPKIPEKIFTKIAFHSGEDSYQQVRERRKAMKQVNKLHGDNFRELFKLVDSNLTAMEKSLDTQLKKLINNVLLKHPDFIATLTNFINNDTSHPKEREYAKIILQHLQKNP